MANYVNHKNKWAFIHIPKTSGGRISAELEEIPYTELIDETHGGFRNFPKLNNYFVFAFVRNPFFRFISGYLHYNRDFLSGTNDTERFNQLSNKESNRIYCDIYQKYIQYNLPLPLGDFIKLVNIIPLGTFMSQTQSELIYQDNLFHNQVNYVAKYENRENELRFISKKIKYDLNQLSEFTDNMQLYSEGIPTLHHNSLKLESQYSKFYTDQWMIDWVVEYYKDDFKNFEYNTN